MDKVKQIIDVWNTNIKQGSPLDIWMDNKFVKMEKGMDRKTEIEDKYGRMKLTNLLVNNIPEIIEYIYLSMEEVESKLFGSAQVAQKEEEKI